MLSFVRLCRPPLQRCCCYRTLSGSLPSAAAEPLNQTQSRACAAAHGLAGVRPVREAARRHRQARRPQAAALGRPGTTKDAGLRKLRMLKRSLIKCLSRDPEERPSAKALLESWENLFDTFGGDATLISQPTETSVTSGAPSTAAT